MLTLLAIPAANLLTKVNAKHPGARKARYQTLKHLGDEQMNLKKTAIVIAGASILATGAVLADSQGRGDRHGGRGMSEAGPMMMVGRLVNRLDLDETQEQEVRNIIDAAKPEFEAIRDRGKETRKAVMALDPAAPDYSAQLNNLALEGGQIVTDTTLLAGRIRSEVHAVLTPEQAAELQSMIDRFGSRMEQMGERRRGRRGGQEPAE